MNDDALLDRALAIATEIEAFRFCGPSDDLDEQTNVIYSFKHLAKKFLGVTRELRRGVLRKLLDDIRVDATDIYGIYDLHSDLVVVIEEIRYAKEHPELREDTLGEIFVDQAVIGQLLSTPSNAYDLSKVASLCVEMNAAYGRGHYVSVALLIRAILNHVPPLFNAVSFSQVVNSSPRSVKALIAPLEEIARDIADHHSHALITHREALPTRSQVEPFKPGFEILLQRVMAAASNTAAPKT